MAIETQNYRTQMSELVHVYKSHRNANMYLYIVQKDDFCNIPEKLLEKFGNPVFVLSFNIAKRQKLARENPIIVKRNLEKHGYHLQLPEPLTALEHNGPTH